MINDLARYNINVFLIHKLLSHHFFLGLDVRWRRLLSVGCRNCSGIFWTGRTFANTWRFVSFLASTSRSELAYCMKLGLWFMILISETIKNIQFFCPTRFIFAWLSSGIWRKRFCRLSKIKIWSYFWPRSPFEDFTSLIISPIYLIWKKDIAAPLCLSCPTFKFNTRYQSRPFNKLC